MHKGTEEGDPKRIVEEGYDRIFEQHSQWAGSVRVAERAKYTKVLRERLLPGTEVLELGCGVGVPTTQELAECFSVTGVDISAQQIAVARRNVPTAKFIHADMTKLDLAPLSFGGVAAFYSLIHVPRHEQPTLVQSIASWLQPGGLMVATMGANSIEAGFEDDWLGAPMYWSSFDSKTNRQMVEEAGLHILSAREETADEFGTPVTFLWIVARKPSLSRESQTEQEHRVSSQKLDGILNYLPISDTIGTAGQPTSEQFADIRAAGYEVVVNLAMPDSTNALPNERALVTGQGMEYIYIPVVFEAPTNEDLDRFFEVMDRNQDHKVFVHCALNWRVSAFTFLYRVLRQGASRQAAEETMRRIWEPDAVWQRLIDETLVRGLSGGAS